MFYLLEGVVSDKLFGILHRFVYSIYLLIYVHTLVSVWADLFYTSSNNSMPLCLYFWSNYSIYDF